MKKLRYILISLIALLVSVSIVSATPNYKIFRTLLPETDNTYDIGSSTRTWANGYFTTLYGDGSNLTGIIGGGVATSSPFSAGYIPYATSPKAITNSVIYQLGGNIGIGTSTPAFSLDVNGKIGISGKQVIYLPNQTNFDGTLIIGDGGGALTHTGADEGWSNTFVGIKVGDANTTGQDNTAVGTYSFQVNTAGYHNTALGAWALPSNIDGYRNLALGSASLWSNSSGFYNSAVGDSTLYSNTTGNYNTGMGGASLYYNQTGSYNTAMGYYAGQGTSGNSFSNSSLYGYQAGNALTTGSNNILIGYKAGDNLATGANNIIIGYDIEAPTSTNSNILNIGNLIFGTGLNATGTIISTGNVGIGTTAPISTLQIATPNNSTYNYLQIDATLTPIASPPAADCDNDAEIGRMFLMATSTAGSNRLYICTGATNGWDYTQLTD